MDLIMIVIFAFILHRTAVNKGVAPWSFVINFAGLGFMLAIAVEMLALRLAGADILKREWYNDPQVQKVMLIGLAFTLCFETLLFFYFRKQINNMAVEEDEEIHPTPPEKKDFSYFR